MRERGEGGGRDSGGQARHCCVSRCGGGFWGVARGSFASPARFPSLAHPHRSVASPWNQSDPLLPARGKRRKEDDDDN